MGYTHVMKTISKSQIKVIGQNVISRLSASGLVRQDYSLKIKSIHGNLFIICKAHPHINIADYKDALAENGISYRGVDLSITWAIKYS